MKHEYVKLLISGLLMLATAPAPAQSNSIRSLRRQAAQQTAPPGNSGGRPANAEPPQTADNQQTRVAGAQETNAPAGQPTLRSANRTGPELRTPLTPARSDQPPSLNPVLLSASMFAVELPTPEKIKVHDLVTIIIREDKKTVSDSKLESKKDWKVDSVFSKWFRLNPQDNLIPTDFPNGAPGVQFDFKGDYQGEGKVDRQDSLITRITASVIDVKPNGNLTLEAKKRIGSDEEEQVVTLTGDCRSKDVTAQNTVLSTQVANLEIRAEHKGAARDAARRGWLMRAFDFLRPI